MRAPFDILAPLLVAGLVLCLACCGDVEPGDGPATAGAVAPQRHPTDNGNHSRNAQQPDQTSQRAAESDAPGDAQDDDPDGDEAGDAPPQGPERGLLDRAADPQRRAPQSEGSAEPVPSPSDPAEADPEQWSVPLGAFRRYLQPAAYPEPPQQVAMRTKDVHTMAELQNAVASNTMISVHGRLRATSDNCITIGGDVHDLIIRFEADAQIRFTGRKTYAGIFRIQPNAQRISFQSPRLIGPGGSTQTCMGIEFIHDDGPDVARDVSIVDGEFRGLNYAIQAHGGCQRLLVQNCHAIELIDYFFFGAKRVQDVTIMNCIAHGVRSNHVIRIFDADRVNIFRNDLKVTHTIGGEMKRTIWLLTGRRVTIAANITRDGRITIGPNPVPEESSPGDRIGHVNMVCNRIIHTHTNKPINLLSGAHDVFLHGNVITTFSDKWLAIGGWNRHARPVRNVRWTDGTIHNGAEMIGREGVVVNEHYRDQPDIGPVAEARN